MERYPFAMIVVEKGAHCKNTTAMCYPRGQNLACYRVLRQQSKRPAEGLVEDLGEDKAIGAHRACRAHAQPGHAEHELLMHEAVAEL